MNILGGNPVADYDNNGYIEEIRSHFPLLDRKINGKSLVYFDNAATTLKPKSVIKAVTDFYEQYTSNIHRGAHLLSEEASNNYENARTLVAQHLSVSSNSIVFTSGTSDSLQMIANGLELSTNDCVLSTHSEHHSNILPWCLSKLKFIPVDNDGRIDLDIAEKVIKENRPKLVCLSYVSNVTGIIHPICELTEIAHRYGGQVVVDAAQSIPHFLLNPSEIGCDYFAFSAHKVIGPSGVGVLYGTHDALEQLGTPKRGGGMVQEVYGKEYSPREIPWRFEAGTPNIEGVIGFAEAISFLSRLDRKLIDRHMAQLRDRLLDIIGNKNYIEILGPKNNRDRVGLVSFRIKGDYMSVDQLSRILSDTFGIICRSGSMCAHPLFKVFSVNGAVRISSFFYNTLDELTLLDEALDKVEKLIS